MSADLSMNFRRVQATFRQTIFITPDIATTDLALFLSCN
jgi:hypothetical protein